MSRLPVFVEDVRDHFGVHSDAVVLHHELHISVIAKSLGRDVPAGRCELDRIRKDVGYRKL